MIKKYKLTDGKLLECPDEKGQIRIYINPSEEDKRLLIQQFNIDEHTLNSCLDPDEISRLELEPDHMVFIFKRPKNYSSKDRYLFKISSMGLFLFKDFLIILMPEDLALFEGKQFMKDLTLNKIMLKIIYGAIYHFVGHLKVINTISDALEQKINASMENKYLLNLFVLEKSLVYYLNAINNNGMLIDKIKYSSNKLGFDSECVELLDDIIIENSQCYKQAEIYSNILSSLMDARASIVSNNLNVLMKTLNMIMIIIMLPTFIVSVFSMNVRIPIAGLSYAFWIIMSLAVVSGAVVSLFFWKRRKW